MQIKSAMAEGFLFAVIQLLLTLTILVDAENQEGFLSIDCGIGYKQRYKDETTGLIYTSDDSFIDTGESHRISPEYKTKSLEGQFWNVRSFPVDKRNCYFFNTSVSTDTDGILYLVRARFMYGNYDGKNSVPQFDIYMGTRWWDSIEFGDASTIITKELIYIALSDHIHVCLCNTNKGTPFISVLELRPFTQGYPYEEAHLEPFARFYIGSQDGKILRYPDDHYDRIWTPYNSIDWTTISSPNIVDVKSDYEVLPSTIVRTAATPANGSDSIYLQLRYNASTYSLYLHFAEVQRLNPNQTREFNIFLNGVQEDSEVQPEYLKPTIYSYSNDTNAYRTLDILIKRTDRSKLPPILNAIEIYTIKDLLQYETKKKEYDAMKNIKSIYRIKRNWQGDPCNPKDYMWEGLICRNVDGSGNPIITSLNLSSSGLSGNIPNDIFNLKSIEYLDLSHNNLTGEVPDFLSQLNSLKVLKLEGNQLSGTIPSELLDRSKKGLLSFSYEGNTYLSCLGSCNKRKRDKVVVAIVASLGGAFIFLQQSLPGFSKEDNQIKGMLVLVTGATSLNKPSFDLPLSKGIDSNKQQFTYEEVMSITSNFGRVLGKGGFGTVYHGYIGNSNTQVAVKIVSPSAQGYQQFQAEAELLTRVHHKCLTALIGYCDEGTNVALIYEYMPNGDLAEHLSGKSGKFLGWKQRLQIAVDAAVGLEYLHNGCKPPIIHRDIKPQNILLNEKMRGKIADFGLSRIFSDEADTHVSTMVAGTLGYLDPEYYMSNRLNEKSDVFSFGVVLFEIITGQPAIAKKNEEKTHIIQWLHSMRAEGEIHDIVDPRLEREFDIDSARKVLYTAMACVAQTSIDRPTMTQVVMELKQCLEMVMTPASDAHGSVPNCLIDVSFDRISGESSLAR